MLFVVVVGAISGEFGFALPLEALYAYFIVKTKR